MEVSYQEGLMVLTYQDFLSLEIDDLSKGKDLANMVKIGKYWGNFVDFGPCWRRPKIPHRQDIVGEIGRTMLRRILYLTLCGHWNS